MTYLKHIAVVSLGAFMVLSLGWFACVCFDAYVRDTARQVFQGEVEWRESLRQHPIGGPRAIQDED